MTAVNGSHRTNGHKPPNRLAGFTPDEEPVTERPRFSFVGLGDLLAGDYRQEFLIRNVLPAGQVGYVCGPAKGCKTTLILDAALSLASGAPFLGYFKPAGTAAVGVITGESGAGNVQETLARMIAAKGIDPEEFGHRASFCFDLPKFNRPGDLRHLQRCIVEHEWRAVFLDPAYLLSIIPPEHHGNLRGAGDALAPFSQMATDTGCSIVIVDHARKNRPGREWDPLELSDISGSGGAEFARFYMLVNRTAPYDPERAGHHSLWLSTGGQAGHGGRWNVVIDEGRRDDPGGRSYCVDVRPARLVIAEREKAREEAREQGRIGSAERAEQAARSDREKILETIRRLGPATKTVIGAKCGVNGTRFAKAWGFLEGDEVLERVCVRKNGRPYAGWAIKGEWRPEPATPDTPDTTHAERVVSGPGQESGDPRHDTSPLIGGVSVSVRHRPTRAKGGAA